MLYSSHIDCDEEESYKKRFSLEIPAGEKGNKLFIRYGF